MRHGFVNAEGGRAQAFRHRGTQMKIQRRVLAPRRAERRCAQPTRHQRRQQQARIGFVRQGMIAADDRARREHQRSGMARDRARRIARSAASASDARGGRARSLRSRELAPSCGQ